MTNVERRNQRKGKTKRKQIMRLRQGNYNDFQDMNRRELCQHIANKFGWEKDAFWNLESTQKIRLCCQQARNMETTHKESIKMMVLLDEVEDRHDLRNWEELKELSANLRSGEEE